MSRAPSPLFRWLEPFAAALWSGFLLCSLVVAIVWGSGVGEAETAAWVQRHFPNPEAGTVGFHSPLGLVLERLLALVDPVWIVLAALNCYAGLAVAEGLATARRWSAWVFGVVLLAAGLAAAAGAVHFTTRLGPQLASVPLGLPLLWCVLVFGSHEGARRILPRGSHGQTALLAGVLAGLTIWNLEPAAWQQRVWWLWGASGAPWSWYASWVALATGMAWCFRRAIPLRRERGRCALTLLVLNGLCLIAHLGAAFRK